MDIGIGIGNTLLDVDGGTLVRWGRRADERGFSTLGSIGRLAWPGFDELIAFAAVAAVTERIRLLTDVLLAPTYHTARLAKMTASLDSISGGRLVLGLGVGARPDDYLATGTAFGERGKRFERQLAELHESWAGRAVGGAPSAFGPTTVRGRIPILFGGDPVRAARRAVRWDAGFTIGGAPPEAAAGIVASFREAHAAAGGRGSPRVVCLAYFGLGDQTESMRQMRAYYAYAGERAEAIAAAVPRSPEAIRDRVAHYAALGVDELVLMPTIPDLGEVDRLADVVFAS